LGYIDPKGHSEMPQSTEILKIRCTRKNRIGFKLYAAHFDNYNDALESLLDSGEKLEVLRRDKIRV